MNKYYQGIWLVLATALISGVSIFVNKFGVKGIEPSLFAGIKNLSVGLVIVAAILFSREWKGLMELKIKEWLKLISVGLIGGSIPFILFFNGLSQTTGAKAGFIHKTMFVYVAVLAVWLLKEKMNVKIVWGFGALLVGLIMFLNISPQSLNFGDGLIFLATLFWAGEIIISKKLLKDLSANIVAGSRMLFGGALIWVFLFFTGKASLVASMPAGANMWILVTVLLLSAYVLTFYHGLKRIPALEATAILALGAPITLLLTIISEGMVITANQVGGILLILASLIYLFYKLRPDFKQVENALKSSN